MSDRMGVTVTNYERSKAFYTAALAPLGIVLVVEYPASTTGNTEVAGFGLQIGAIPLTRPEFWINQGTPKLPLAHVAFRVPSREVVEAFHAAALAAGGRDNGVPGLRPYDHPENYYAAFVLDPDGNNIEVVCQADS
ncbi:MAG TPA: VOC family protein [Leptolyngbyaceae cyanobacterium]